MRKNVLKTAVPWLFMLPVVMILFACPYSSPYKLDAGPTVAIDDSLIGKWATMVVKWFR